MSHCTQCGATLASTQRFCSQCGEAASLDGADLPLSSAVALASQLLAEGEIDKAIALLNPHVAGDSPPHAAFALGAAYMQRGNYAEAMPLLLEATDWMPEDARAHAYLAMAYLHTYRPAEGRDAIDRAVALDPEDFAVNLKHGEFLFRLGYYRESITPLERALAVSAPDGASLAFTRRLLQMARQKAPNTFTRPVNPLPRFSWLRRLRPKHATRIPDAAPP